MAAKKKTNTKRAKKVTKRAVNKKATKKIAKKAVKKVAKKKSAKKVTKKVAKKRAVKKVAKKKAKKTVKKVAKKAVKKVAKKVTKKVAQKRVTKKVAKKAAKKAVKKVTKKAAQKVAVKKVLKKKTAKKTAKKVVKKAVAKMPAVKVEQAERLSILPKAQPIEPVKLVKELKGFDKKQYQKLLDLRDNILDLMQGVTNDRLKNDDMETGGGSMHAGDASSDAYDRDFALNMLAMEQDSLNEVGQAISRAEAGVYGICEMSGDRIPKERLEAIPFARYTVKCQELYEQTNGNSRNHSRESFSFSNGSMR